MFQRCVETTLEKWEKTPIWLSFLSFSTLALQGKERERSERTRPAPPAAEALETEGKFRNAWLIHTEKGERLFYSTLY